MKQCLRRAAALGLALLIAAGSTAASASEALGWALHTGKVPLSQGAGLEKNIFWSDTYSDLRAEYYVEYTPNPDVTPTVAYGDTVLTRATLSEMAAGLEAQGNRVVSGINGDWYVLATGVPTGLVVTGGAVRATPDYEDAWAVGFRSDGSAFIAQPRLSLSVTAGEQVWKLTGGINKIRKVTAPDGSGGLTLLTSDFAAETQNTQPGVDVILYPVEDGTGLSSPEPRIGRQTQYIVEQVLESAGSIPIPQGRAVLTLNASDNPALLEALRALQPGDPLTLTVDTPDSRWTEAEQALGGTYRIAASGQVCEGLPTERTAWTAVGIRADGSVVFYTVDGKQAGHSVGATLTQVAQRLIELGCVDALGMDGGGSTTLGAALPGQSGMQVLNRPSGGAQRANSTAIFLTTRLQPVGDLAAYYVTPSDSILLAGSSVQLSAAPLDSHYYAAPGGVPVEWLVSEGGGTVDETGLFTAGSESGLSQVTATDGYASGTAYLTTVRTPDSITLTNEATGAAVSALSLEPEEQVDLAASAVYRKLSLLSQDESFTWTADPAVGAVDETGRFTAGALGASGSLTVSAGETSVTIPVSVAGHVYPLEDCEGEVPSFVPELSAFLDPERDLDYVRCGRQSWRLTYDLPASGSAALTGALSIPSGERYLGLWIYGDGSGHLLLATATDAALQQTPFLLAALDFTGWKHVSVPLPENTLTLTGLQILRSGAPDAAPQSGMIWLDQFTTSNQEFHDVTPPVITLRRSGTQLTAAVTDNVDRTFAAGQITLTYDGASIPFYWDEAAGTLSATLPAAGETSHRVSVTAADASGNLGRSALTIEPEGERDGIFSDMAEHWANSYALYLYDTGVTKGVPVGEELQFQPDKDITRAEFFALVARWLDLNLDLYAGVELPFADGDSIPEWALGEVKAMYSLGLLKGALADGQVYVKAGATISRAEAMTILGRTQPMGYGGTALSAPDAGQVPGWALPYVQSLGAQGVLGDPDSAVRPLDLLTRGEMAMLLYQMR